MKCLIYTRVSTDEQAKDGVSLDAQEVQCKRYATENQLDVMKVFREEGVSAKTTDRPILNEMLKYLAMHPEKIDSILIWKLDRVSRNTYSYLEFKIRLASLGINLISVTEFFEDNAAGKLSENLVAVLSQFENDVKSERTKLGMAHRSNSGCWVHQAPLGYSNYKNSTNQPTLKLNGKSEKVRRILLAFSTGTYSITQLTNLANDIGLRTNKDKPVTFELISKMLRNPLYAGKIQNTFTESMVEGIHEPLIDLETFDKNQILLDPKKKLKITKLMNVDWPLRDGRTYCAFCKIPLTGGAPKGKLKYYPKYQCRKCRKSDKGVSTSRDRDLLHDEFEEFLNTLIPTDRTIKDFKHVVLKKWRDEYIDIKSKINTLQTQLNALEDKKDTILNKFVSEELSSDEKERLITKVDSEYIAISREINELTGIKLMDESVIDYCIRFISNIAKIWRDADTQLKQHLQIVLFPSGLEYEFGSGFRTPELSPLFRFADTKKDLSFEEKSLLVTPRRIELRLPD